jgi:phosphopantothenoylcysteine decarboxylase/phosphopantothenate--cysteine ligase
MDAGVLKDLNILLGVTGGIAAYKAVDLASKLTGAGANVRAVMTESACQLVGPKSFEAVTSSPVFTSLWNEPGPPTRSIALGTPTQGHQMSHIALADWAEIVVIAPATADIIAKVANGICDDLLSTVLCTCWATPTLFAPAMNTRMWENPATQRNVETLRATGVRMVGPAAGRLACGTEGMGRMAEPQDILAAIEALSAEIVRKK